MMLMAVSMRDPKIEQRLQRWAQWLKVGDGSGFPSMSVLHPEWQPPSPGTTPTLKVGTAGDDVKQTHRLIGLLSQRMQTTLVVHYVKGGAVADQAAELAIAESTVHERIDRAHRQLLRLLADPGSFCNMEQTG